MNPSPLQRRFMLNRSLVLWLVLAFGGQPKSTFGQITSTWDAGVTGNWSNADNWNTPFFPNNGNGGANYNAIISNGSVTLDQDITIEDFTLTGGPGPGQGTLTAAGSTNLTVNHLMTWSRGTLQGAGTTTIAPGGTLDLVAFINTTLSQTLINTGHTNFNPSDFAFVGGAFQNNGSLTTSGGFIRDDSFSGGVFNNAGAFTKLGPGTTHFQSTILALPFNNSGLVDVQQGALNLLSGGSHTGNFSIANGSTLRLQGSHNFAPFTTMNGVGTMFIFSGTTTFAGQLPAGGIVTLRGGLDISSTTSGGTLNLTGILTGSGIVSFNTLNWTSGAMSGTGATVVSSGAISGVGDVQFRDRTLRLAGTLNLSGPGISTPFGAARGSIVVPTGSIFTTSGSGTKTLSANLQIDAGGTLHHTSTGSTTQTGTFLNNGLVQVDAGTLSFNSGGSGSGEFVVAPGTALQFNGPGHNYTGGVTLSGGTLQVANYTLENGAVRGNGTIDATTFTNAGGVLSPGFSVGAIDIDGDYTQTSGGEVVIEIDSLSSFDEIDISGVADFGGTLTVELNDLSIGAGEEFVVISAGSLAPGSKFDRVVTVGGGDIHFRPVYDESDPDQLIVKLQSFEFTAGDMNGDGSIDENDALAIALALQDPARFARENPLGMDAVEAGDRHPVGAGGLDGDFDFDDVLIIFEEHFSTVMSIGQFSELLSQAAVPEPNAAALTLLGVAALASRGRLRRNCSADHHRRRRFGGRRA